MEKVGASGLTTGSRSHLIPCSPLTDHLYERQSGFSGLPQLFVGKTEKDIEERGSVLQYIKQEKKRKCKNNNSNRNVYDDENKNGVRDPTGRKDLKRYYDCVVTLYSLNDQVNYYYNDITIKWMKTMRSKWSALYIIQNMRLQPMHRFAPDLETKFRRSTPYINLDRLELSRILLDNFALDRETREQCNEACHHVFDALDENFDGLVDWRDLIAHFIIMDKPKRHTVERLDQMFDLYAMDNSNNEYRDISLGEMWKIIRSFSLLHQRETIANLFLSQLNKYFVNVDFTNHLMLDELVNSKTNLPRSKQWQPVFEVLNQVTSSIKPEDVELDDDDDQRKQMYISKKLYQQILLDPSPKENGLFLVLDQYSWDRLPNRSKLRLVKSRQDESAKSFEFYNQQIRWAEAKAWFGKYIRPNVLKNTMRKWKVFTWYKGGKRKGELFFLHKSKRVAFEKLGLYAESKIFDRWRNNAADRFAIRIRKAWSFRRWNVYKKQEKRVYVIQQERAKRLYTSFQLETCFNAWKENATCLRQLRDIYVKWRLGRKRDWFDTWHSNVKKSLEQRNREDKRGEMRQMILQQELEEAERKINLMKREKEEERVRMEEEKRRLEEERKEEEERWEREKMRAFEASEQLRILKRQEEQRSRLKKDVREREIQEFKNTWLEIEKNAKEEAEREATLFLKTNQGREQIKIEAEAIQNESAQLKQGSAKTAVEENPNWVKLFDPEVKGYFFYNKETGEKIHATTLSTTESKNIAESNYVLSMVKLAMEDVAKLKEQAWEEKQLIWAGKVLQGAWRVKKSRKLIRDLIQELFIKRVDPYEGHVYYYNLQTRKSLWTKPLNLRKNDIKTPEWVLRCDADGNWYYENKVSPWMTSQEKPQGQLQCLVCNLQLAIFTCKDCFLHYCLDCFEEAHPITSEEFKTHKFKKKFYKEIVKSPPVKCIVCKTNNAANYCPECGIEEFYCNKCYKLSHTKNPKKKKVTAKQKHAPAIQF